MTTRQQAYQAINNAVMLPRERILTTQYLDGLEKIFKVLLDAVVQSDHLYDLKGHGMTENEIAFVQMYHEQIPYPHGWEP